MQAHLSRLFAISVREVMPLLLKKRLSYTFADHGCEWQLGDVEAHMLDASFHRLYCAAADMIDEGFIAFHATARRMRSGPCSLRLHIGATGRLAAADKLEQALWQLSVVREQGVCPSTGARIEFAPRPESGFVLTAIYKLKPAAPDAVLNGERPHHGAVAARPAARAAPNAPRLWLVHGDRINAASVVRQAQQHGWAVTVLHSLEDALKRLRPERLGQALPSLVLVFGSDATPPAAVRSLLRQLPAGVTCLHAVEAGLVWLREPAGSESSEMVCHPLCRDDWAALAERHAVGPPAAPAIAGSDLTSPWREAPIPVLVADDEEVCCQIAQAMLEALGCQIRLARDGSAAIALCSERPPSLVLMDLDMPVVDGFEAIRHLRRLQGGGLLAPFRILAVSSAPDSAWTQRALDAGADAFLAKPLRMESLGGELNRWCAARHHIVHGAHPRALAPAQPVAPVP